MQHVRKLLFGRSSNLVVVLLAVIVSLAMGSLWRQPSNSYAQEKGMTSAQRAALVGFENAFTAIAEDVSPSVVSIRTEKTVTYSGMVPDDMFKGFPFGDMFPQAPGGKQKVRGAGSGVIVRADGYILTNDHVAGNADEVIVILRDKREFKGKVLRDPRSDLALVKIDAKGLPVAKLGDSNRVRVGSWAIALGNPFGLSNTLTVGVISALNRSQVIGGGSEDIARSYPDMLQTDAAINPGNSGGPLVNINGEVVGINTAIESPTGGSVGIGFAIPVNTAKDVMDALITNGRVVRGYMGVKIGDLTPDRAKALGVTEGAVIVSVDRGSPADKANITAGDVIVLYNGVATPDSATLTKLVGKTNPGKVVKIVLVRDKKRVPTDVKLIEMPKSMTQGITGDESAKDLGLVVDDLTPNRARQLGIPLDTRGALVTSVARGGPASEAGIRVYDVIIKVGSSTIRDAKDFADAAAAAEPGKEIMMVIQRGDEPSQVAFVQVPEK